MKKLFLTSGLVICLACPAFADSTDYITGVGNDTNNPNNECTATDLGGVDGSTGNDTANIEATWTAKSYDVTYAPGSHGTGGDTFANDATYDTNYTLKAIGNASGQSTVVANTGYHFTGWLGSSKATGYTPATYTETQTLNPYEIDGALTLTAQWAANTHKIQYVHGTAGARDTGFTGSTADTSTTYDGSVTIASNGFSITGYQFDGWKSPTVLTTGAASSTQGGESYSAGDVINPYKVDADVTLTAQWTPLSYTISYGSGLHGSVPNNVNEGVDPIAYANGLTYDATWSTKSFAETGIVADTGYTFSGWNTNQNGTGTPYAANTQQSAWTTDGGLTLYAIYTANTHSITYNCGSVPGGSQSSLTNNPPAAVASIAYDAEFSLSTTEGGCALQGYHFGGWHCSHTLTTGSTNNNAGQDYASAETSEGSGVWQVSASGTFKVDADVTCSVIWTPNEIGLNWNTNGGTVDSAGGDACTYDAGIQLPTNPHKTGYSFGGWSVVAPSNNNTPSNPNN